MYVSVYVYYVFLLAWHEGGCFGSSKWRYEFFSCFDIHCYVDVFLLIVCLQRSDFFFCFFGVGCYFGVSLVITQDLEQQMISHDIIITTEFSFLTSRRDCYFRLYFVDFTKRKNLENNQHPPTFGYKRAIINIYKNIKTLIRCIK